MFREGLSTSNPAGIWNRANNTSWLLGNAPRLTTSGVRPLGSLTPATPHESLKASSMRCFCFDLRFQWLMSLTSRHGSSHSHTVALSADRHSQ